jgi:hypothetical protein
VPTAAVHNMSMQATCSQSLSNAAPSIVHIAHKAIAPHKRQASRPASVVLAVRTVDVVPRMLPIRVTLTPISLLGSTQAPTPGGVTARDEPQVGKATAVSQEAPEEEDFSWWRQAGVRIVVGAAQKGDTRFDGRAHEQPLAAASQIT